MEYFVQLIISGIVLGGIYALVALGIVLIYKSSQVFNFAHGQILMVGAYIGWTMAMVFHLPFVPTLLITLAGSALLGLIIERLVLRPMIGEPVIAVIMVTIGLASMLNGSMMSIVGTMPRRFEFMLPDDPISILGAPISATYLYSFGIAIVFVVLFTLFFRYTSLGIAMRAASDDQQTALSMGISVKMVFMVAWAIAAAVAGAGGMLLGNLTGVGFGLIDFGLIVFPVVILGGFDSIAGAIIGGLIIGVLQNLSGAYLDGPLGGGVKNVFPFVVLVAILMIRPHGLFGRRAISRL